MPNSPLPKLLFGENAGHSFSDADAFYAFLRETNPAVLSVPPSNRGFALKGALLEFPHMKIITSASHACEITTQFAATRFNLIIPLAGQGLITNGQRTFAWDANDTVIYNALKEVQTFTFHTMRSQVLFEIDTERVQQAMVSMFGSELNWSLLLSNHATVEHMSAKHEKVKSLLLSSLALIDETAQDTQHLTRIGFDDVIIRLVAEMVAASAGANLRKTDVGFTKRSHRAVNVICDIVLQPGSSPLTMTEMEDTTGMTSRALCYAFQERFGCSPQEWQRNHYLDQAHNELCRGDNVSSVKAIARRFGFATPRSFARFYRQRFGEAPTDTQRQLGRTPVPAEIDG